MVQVVVNEETGEIEVQVEGFTVFSTSNMEVARACAILLGLMALIPE